MTAPVYTYFLNGVVVSEFVNKTTDGKEFSNFVVQKKVEKDGKNTYVNNFSAQDLLLLGTLCQEIGKKKSIKAFSGGK